MKKVALFIFSVFSLCSTFGQTGNQWNIPVDMTGTDSMYIWKPIRTDNYLQLWFDVSSFEAEDSVTVDLYYLVKDRYTNQYLPTQIENGVTDYLPITISANPYAGNGAMSHPNGDTTYIKSVKIENFLGDGLGIEIGKGTAEAGDTVKVIVRK